jgi:uncharacterized surface protein with fasciclin (FAS1) repeats
MYASKDIMDNAKNSADHTTLVSAIKAAGLVETLKGTGPFTVFAPTNEAFAGFRREQWVRCLNQRIGRCWARFSLTHVVSGSLSVADFDKQIKAGNGSAELKSIAAALLLATRQGGHIVLKDEKGNLSRVEHSRRISVKQRDSGGGLGTATELSFKASWASRIASDLFSLVR